MTVVNGRYEPKGEVNKGQTLLYKFRKFSKDVNHKWE